ncbi:AraC family transcriptional regulator [Embleya sp. NBC_00896]|uniref:AraC family transcriptional regulator n=1 Tax=Embleya sp. NBC_00896 TaxID=2975961 RepID=UPI00386E4809|nr:AraC family transcriptional regulator [Embleya sp. NBC_00896]
MAHPVAARSDSRAAVAPFSPAGGYELYRGGDQSLLHPLLDRHFTRHEMEVVGRRPLDACFRALHQGTLTAYDLSYGTDVVVSPGDPPDVYIIRLAHRGRASLNVAGGMKPFSPSVVNPGQVVVARWDADTRARILCVPRQLLARAMHNQIDEATDEPLAFHTAFDLRVPEALTWLRVARRFTEAADAGLFAASPLAIAHFELSLVHGLLASHPHRLSEQIQRSAPVRGTGALQRALAYCEAHAAEPISVADIAAAGRVSVRTLQEQFRVHLDTTPMGHLRRVRLAGAHADLVAVAQGRASGTVTEIAAAWGFPQRRHFAALYRAAYRHAPSQTIGGR